VCGGANFSGTFGTVAGPTGYTIRTNTAANTYDGSMATKSLSASGAENPSAYTNFKGPNTSADDWWDGFTVTFTDAAGGGATVTQRIAQLNQAVTRAANW
jgi:hypothetical protein